jgi:hypothetical protein
MFFEIFWATYVPIAIIIVYLVEEWLKQSCHRLRAHERLAHANRRGNQPQTTEVAITKGTLAWSTTGMIA